MNEILAITSLLVFAAIIIAGCRFGKEFLFVFGCFSVVASNALFAYEVKVFGLSTTWAVFAYCMNFLAINCLTEFYSKRDAWRFICMMVVAQLSFYLYIESAKYLVLQSGHQVKVAVESVYAMTPRITVAAMLAHSLLMIDAHVYQYFKNQTGRIWGALWFRATLSALVAHLVINIVFFFVAFYGTLPTAVIWQIILANILIKYVLSFTETPLMYVARAVMNKRPATV